VAGSYRRQGLGRTMLAHLIFWARRNGKDSLTLEVRTGNRQALGLYRSLGFTQIGVHEGYYSDTGEDALLLELRLGPEPAERTFPDISTIPRKPLTWLSEASKLYRNGYN